MRNFNIINLIHFQDSNSKVKSLRRYPRGVKNSSRRVLQSSVLGISFCFWQKMLKKIILSTNQIRNIIWINQKGIRTSKIKVRSRYVSQKFENAATFACSSLTGPDKTGMSPEVVDWYDLPWSWLSFRNAPYLSERKQIENRPDFKTIPVKNDVMQISTKLPINSISKQTIIIIFDFII